MRKITTAMAGLALSALITAGPTTEAKADGGAVAIGVGAYLLADALVGRECQRHEWPLNMISKLADELRGGPGCYRHPVHRHHHRRHHHHKKHQ
jgi:hypothetical protein